MISLRSRLILGNLLPLLLVVPVVGLMMVYLLETQGIVASVSRDLARQAILVADTASLQPAIWQDRGTAREFLARISPRLSARVMLLDTGGRMVASSNPQDEDLTGTILYSGQFMSVSKAEEEALNSPGGTREVVIPVVRRDGLLLGFVRMDNPLSEVYLRSQQLRQVAVWVVGIGLILGIGLGWAISRDLTRQIQTATHAVTNLSSGQNLTPLEETGKPREIAQFFRAFNSLVERLINLEENRKRLLANLVHELGRPLGSLQSAVQALKSGADRDHELRTDLLDGMAGELHRLDHLVGDLANLHNELAGTLILDRKPVDVGEWLRQITGTYREEAANKGLEWVSEIPSTLPAVNLDAGQLTLAVQNLITNAIRYTPSGGKVEVSGKLEGEDLIIEVQDSGPGIADDEVETIFEPFKRGRSAKRFSQGMGLGLTIARDLVEAHGGRIDVLSVPGRGSTFRIVIPVAGS